jgi:aconitate hydratase
MSHNLFNTLQEFKMESGKAGKFYSLPALEKSSVGKISRLPVSIRIVLEAVLRNYDGKKIAEEHVKQLANWRPDAPRVDEIPFIVARIILQDFTGCDARHGKQNGQEPQSDRTAGASGFGCGSLGAG